ncbi:DNA repair endonuclease XPF [Nymphon striatum]|nr:DNA repair endonuclease XPF [Nymphon striatum]
MPDPKHTTLDQCIIWAKTPEATSEKSLDENSQWLVLDSAEEMFVRGRERIFGSKSSNNKKSKSSKNATEEPEIEVNPKWCALSQVLDEIKEDTVDLKVQTHTLILAEDERTCSQLQQYLTKGSQYVLRKILNSASFYKGGDGSKNQESIRDKKIYIESKASTESSSSNDQNQNDATSQNGAVINETLTTFHAMRYSNDPFFVYKFLEQFHPPYVVMYDADMNVVRQLEVYKASNSNIPLRVYFLVHEESAEEQRYLTTLRKEKQAFEFLIREKVTMVVPSDIEGRCEDNPDLLRDQTPAKQTNSTRRGGIPSASIQPEQKVIVDMREFRSELPSLIHQRGIEIEPVTLEIGDYILTPDICVERKSVSDLISSLNCGRLYNQAQAMTRYYKRPMLLIEFDQNKSFSLNGKFCLSNEGPSMNDVTSKLVLLTLHFPKLRIMWSPNPYATAELIEELKADRPQPDASKALAISSEASTEIPAEIYNYTSQNLLSKLPGVNQKNLKTMLRKGQSLPELCEMTKDELNQILENTTQSCALFDGFHQRLSSVEVTTDVKNKSKKRKYNRRAQSFLIYKATASDIIDDDDALL